MTQESSLPVQVSITGLVYEFAIAIAWHDVAAWFAAPQAGSLQCWCRTVWVQLVFAELILPVETDMIRRRLYQPVTSWRLLVF